MTKEEALKYEIANSFFAKYASSDFLQGLFGIYYRKKVNKKYRKYMKYLMMEEIYNLKNK